MEVLQEDILCEAWFFSAQESCTRILKLYKNYIALYTDDYQPELIQIMELDLVKCQFDIVGRTHKIKFMKNLQFYEIITRDIDTFDEWYNHLRSLVILNDFHEQFDVIKMIGKGSFARVGIYAPIISLGLLRKEEKLG